ncbi:hypothetical protein HY224_02925 [Candidatus Uhrbacteria bacterium]|nr:hypothetical protein [Candidatus Uhrbacteria bacterium]
MHHKVLFKWLPLAFLTTVLAGLSYVAVQQSYRQSANDPQIQMSEDISAALANGATVQSFIPMAKVDMATSLAPFVIIFNDTGMPVASSGVLDGQAPVPPPGVLAYAREHGQNRLTWQPKPTVRSAIVVTRYSNGYVLAGRSLREVERRVGQLTFRVFLAWVIGVVGTFLLVAFREKVFGAPIQRIE